MPDALPLRPCEHARCKRRVFDAQIIKLRGAPVELVLDAVPQTWEQGARLKIIPAGGVKITVTKLTATMAYKAFGRDVVLYVEHREMCQAEQRKTKAKKGAGHA